ncbi:MAG: enoyl-CoA hydratase/isomerase family protein [Leptospiraceae bacterium]|nr:enoyl-CoA hydratase/isomerase family protein [Leptospiraceae bacterium]
MITENRRGHVFELTLNTNEKNTFDEESFAALAKSLASARDDDGIKVVLISAKEGKFFSNGFEPTMFLDKSYEQIHPILAITMESTADLLLYPKPVLCYLNGHALGVGAVLALFCDYRIMLDGKGRIGFPESRIGLNFPTISAYILNELVGPRTARRILFSGLPLKPRDALECGLVDEVVSEEAAPGRIARYCRQFEGMAMESVVGIKRSLVQHRVSLVRQQSKIDQEELARAIASPNGQEGMRSILEARSPVFQ